MTLAAVLARVDADLSRASARLLDLLRIPSISTDPAYEQDCARAADWLVANLQSLGFAATARPTRGHPMVVAQGGSGGPHLLFYGHYDVQQVDPLGLSNRPPFEPEIQNSANGPVIRGRGASDDKGQVMTFLEALRAWTAIHGTLPCRLTVFLEGEEESGSPSLVPFLQDNAAELTADIALICDTGLYDAEGRITIPGFYDAVDELPDALRAQWRGLAFDHAGFLGAVGLTHPAARPTAPRFNCSGRARPPRSTASGAAIPATASRLSCPVRPMPSSAFVWSRAKTPKNCAPRFAPGSRRTCRPIARWNSTATAPPPPR